MPFDKREWRVSDRKAATIRPCVPPCFSVEWNRVVVDTCTDPLVIIKRILNVQLYHFEINVHGTCIKLVSNKLIFPCFWPARKA